MLHQQRVVTKDRLQSFFLEERLPEGWARPLHALGFLKTLEMGGKLRAEMDKYIEKEAQKAAMVNGSSHTNGYSNGNGVPTIRRQAYIEEEE